MVVKVLLVKDHLRVLSGADEIDGKISAIHKLRRVQGDRKQVILRITGFGQILMLSDGSGMG